MIFSCSSIAGLSEAGTFVQPGAPIEVDALVRDAEGVRTGRLPREVVVEQDAAVREEGPEVDDRAVELRREVARSDPLDRDDRLARALGRLRDVVGLEHGVGREAVRLLKLPSPTRKYVLFIEPCEAGHEPVASVCQPTPVLGGKACRSPFAPRTPFAIRSAYVGIRP